jgi:hypothetical protein
MIESMSDLGLQTQSPANTYRLVRLHHDRVHYDIKVRLSDSERKFTATCAYLPRRDAINRGRYPHVLRIHNPPVPKRRRIAREVTQDHLVRLGRERRPGHIG